MVRFEKGRENKYFKANALAAFWRQLKTKKNISYLSCFVSRPAKSVTTCKVSPTLIVLAVESLCSTPLQQRWSVHNEYDPAEKDQESCYSHCRVKELGELH